VLTARAARSPRHPSEGDCVIEDDSVLRDLSGTHELQIEGMRLHALDAWVRRASVLTDADELKAILYAGADAGGATVLGEQFCLFPNGAVTGVLVLAQSHLSIHTWPEFALANIDLLSYGDIRGDAVLDEICSRLDVERANVTCIERALD
jgi:S-adenosylmethionine decarboxylase